jgi:hypothetical protein
MVISPTKVICRYQRINLLHMLSCDPLSSAKLLWPLVESFHVHPHIHANSYTGSYAKHAIHTPKISTPSSKEISLLAKGERGHWKKSICSRSIGKNVLQSKSIEKKKSETWTPSKIKARWEYQSKEYLENKQKYSTHMHISIKLHD